jgi:hypothetical protein
MEFRAADSALKRGFTEASMIHVLRNAISFEPAQGDHDLDVAVGPDETGRLLEVGFVATDDLIVFVHVMPARPKYLR